MSSTSSSFCRPSRGPTEWLLEAEVGQSHAWALETPSLASSRVLLTPGLRLNQLQLDAGSGLVVLPDLSTHAEAQRDHVVLLTVPGTAAFDVVKQGRLQGATLRRKKGYQGLNQGLRGRQDWLSPWF